MNKKALTISAVIVLAIAGGVGYLLATGSGKSEKEAMLEQTGVSTSATADPAVTGQPTGGMYVDYSEGVIANTPGTKLLFFHAPWCPQCRDLEADIKAKGVPDGVTIIKVDYDSSQQLRRQYGVTLQTTLVKVDDNGNLVEKFVAYDEPTLDAVVKNLL